jgi:uncharacterized protein YciI
MREQEQWGEHAAFMDALADENFIVLGGPLGNGRDVLFFIQAASEEEINARLADDPWTHLGLLRTVTVEPWEILLGKDRATGALAVTQKIGGQKKAVIDELPE